MPTPDELLRHARQAESDVTYWTVRAREIEADLERARRYITNRGNDAASYRRQAAIESARINSEFATILGDAA